MSKETLSNNIRFYRKAQGMTQIELAEKLFIVPQTVSKWESGISEPDSKRLCLLADLFGISLERLVRISAAPSKKAYIAVDGGGTKTEFLLFCGDGEVLERFTLGGSNPNAYGLSVAKNILAEGIERLLSNSDVSVVGIFAGISGAGAGKNREELGEFLKKRFPYVKSRVEGDFFNVISSDTDREKYIAVICGTGSVVYACSGEDRRRLGGWGYLFDEAGSGFDIGRELFRHCLACEDEGRSHDELYVALSKALGGGIFANISDVYAKGKDYVASFAPLVFEYYERGNMQAQAIVEKTADRLAYLINMAYEKYDCGEHAIIAGGLTARRDILKPLLEARVRKEINLIFSERPPIFGAAARCIKLFGEDVDTKGAIAKLLLKL